MSINKKLFGIEFQQANIHGIEIFHFFKKNSPIRIQATIHAGARYDEKSGTAHFTEHMICAGTENFPSKDKLAEYIENVGGSFSLETDSDVIRVSAEVADRDDLSVAISVLDEIINKPLLRPETLENERGSILSEYTKIKTNQDRFVWNVYRRLFFQQTDAEKSPIGDPNSISSISLEDVTAFRKKYFNNNNVVIISCGDIDIKTLTEKLDSVLTNIPHSSKTPAEISQLPIITEKLSDIEIYPNSKQANTVIGFRTKTDNIADEICGQVCADYLAGGRASFLMKKLRYEKGLVYNISASSNVYADRSTFVVQTSCESEKFPGVKNIIAECFENFKNDSLFIEKLDAIKTHLKKSFFIKLQTSESWLKYNSGLAIMPDKNSIIDYLYAIDAVNPEIMKKYLKKNFSDNTIFTAVCGPESIKKFL